MTSRLKDAITLMNSTPAKKFPLLLQRIIAKLHVSGSSFTDAEQEKLAKIMSLSGTELSTVLEAVAYIFEKAVYEGAKPSKLQQSLSAVGLTDSCISAFTSVWTEHRLAAKEAAAKNTISGPRVLSSFAWRTNMHLSKSSTAKLKDQSAIFDFTTRSADAKEMGKAQLNDDEDQFAVELSHAELYDFFLKLEKIQEQLDGLGK